MSTREGLSIATLNTRGTPVRRSQLPGRYAAIGAAFEASDVEVVNLQEVHTYFHLRLLQNAMPSFGHVNFRRSMVGPAGGVVTLSRRPVTATGYRRLPIASGRLPLRSKVSAPFKGALITRLKQPAIWIVNTHLLANTEGDWSDGSRFTPVHQGQLAALTRLVKTFDGPLIVCGDFNIARDSTPYADFARQTGLVDAFGGQSPPTFHAEYLGPGKTPHCIDFVLLNELESASAEQIFTTKVDLPQGPAYVSDHLGLQVSVRNRRRVV